MKGIYITTIIIIFLCMVMFPLFAMKQTVIPSESNNSADVAEEVFRVYITDTKEIKNVKVSDYLIGVVGAEMSADNEVEALKAQAVVSYTYALRKKEMRSEEEYDITDSFTTDQAYFTIEKLKEKWGSNFDKNYKKLSDIVQSVKGEKILYDGKPILAVCHSISGGKTEAAENVWGQAYPYLLAVESAGDVLNPNYLSVENFSVDEFKEKAKELKVELKGDADSWIGESSYSDSGMVLTMNLGGTDVTGRDIRSAFNLRSSNFDVVYKDGQFTFNVRGYGHGVGLSQSGAQFMAQQGSSYTEILTWYYKNCQIK